MNITFRELDNEADELTAAMITDLMNYHRKLTNAPKEFWTTNEQSLETLKEWKATGTIYNVLLDDIIIGFFYIRFGGQNAAWLEDLFIIEKYRGRGIGKQAFAMLDELMKAKGVIAMFVNVIPRNISAIKFYMDCGFDHLNMIELRKNYQERLNKTEEIDILGFKLKKY